MSAPGSLPPNPWHDHVWMVGEPKVGAGTWIGAFAVLDASGGLTIGEGCDIGAGTQIYTHSTIKRCVSGRRYNAIDRLPVTIGDRVFISGGVMISMGVTIGDESVVLAGSVVSKDVLPRTVMAGAPARAIGRIEFDDDGEPQIVMNSSG